jgi:hypothetical protein
MRKRFRIACDVVAAPAGLTVSHQSPSWLRQCSILGKQYNVSARGTETQLPGNLNPVIPLT